jgi:hypothetical protein
MVTGLLLRSGCWVGRLASGVPILDQIKGFVLAAPTLQTQSSLVLYYRADRVCGLVAAAAAAAYAGAA